MAALSLTEGDRGEALLRERDLWEAYRAADRDRLEGLLDPLALDVGPGWIHTRDGVLAAVARMRIASFEIEDLTVRSAGEVEIVTYIATVEGTYGGAPFPARRVRATTVWYRSASGWRVAHRHESTDRARDQT